MKVKVCTSTSVSHTLFFELFWRLENVFLLIHFKFVIFSSDYAWRWKQDTFKRDVVGRLSFPIPLSMKTLTPYLNILSNEWMTILTSSSLLVNLSFIRYSHETVNMTLASHETDANSDLKPAEWWRAANDTQICWTFKTNFLILSSCYTWACSDVIICLFTNILLVSLIASLFSL